MKNSKLIQILVFLLVGMPFLMAQTNNKTEINLEKAGYKLLYEDNFNKPGKPSSSDWLFRNNKKFGGVSCPDNVVQQKSDDGEGCLLIKFTQDTTRKANEQYLGGGIVSTHNFGYGYYECRVKLYGGSHEMSGLHQSFWTMGLTGTNEAEGAGVRDSLVNADAIPAQNQVLEIDGFEHDSKHNVLAFNHHIYSPKHEYGGPKPGGLSKDLAKWIVMGYEWLPDRINYYCDGSLVSTKMLIGKWSIYAPQNFWFTALPVDILSWGGLKPPAPNAVMKVDYFRYYAKALQGTNLIGNPGFEYGVKGNTYPLAWIVARNNGNNKNAVKVLTDSLQAESGKRYLVFDTSQKCKATVKQNIEYISNGKYEFSVSVKNTGSENGQLTILINTGSKQLKKQVKASTTWESVILSGITVKNNRASIEIVSDINSGGVILVDEAKFILTK